MISCLRNARRPSPPTPGRTTHPPWLSAAVLAFLAGSGIVPTRAADWKEEVFPQGPVRLDFLEAVPGLGLFAATQGGLLFRSADSGRQWAFAGQHGWGDFLGLIGDAKQVVAW